MMFASSWMVVSAFAVHSNVYSGTIIAIQCIQVGIAGIAARRQDMRVPHMTGS
jgi:hypothetical protein